MNSHSFQYNGGILRSETYNPSTGQTSYQTFLNRLDYSNTFTVITDTHTGDLTRPHPCSFTKQVHHRMSVDYHSRSKLPGIYGYGTVHQWGKQGNPATGGLNAFADFQTVTYNKALGKLSDRIRGDLDLLIDLLEYESTVKMVTPAVKICHGFVNVVNTVQSLYRHKLDKQNLDKIANVWLQYTYGVKPLVNSMYGFMEKLRDERRCEMSVTVRAQSEHLYQNVAGSGYARLISDVKDIDRCELNVVLNLKPDVYDNLAGISSLNPISLAWELFPYSFVIDWVWDLGSYLHLVETAMMYDRFFKQGYKTLTSKRNIQSRYPDEEESIPSNYVRQSGYGDSLGFKKDRSVLGVYPLPYLPVVNCDLGWRRIASATALAYGALRRTGADVGRR